MFGLAFMVPLRSEGASSRKAEDQRAREKAAKKACAVGDFRKGVELLAELYVETDNVTHVYNQGRCYEQNHQWVSAIDRFREYLRKNTNGTPAEKSDAEKHIADCEAFRQQEEPNPALAPTALPIPGPPGPPVASVATTAAPETTIARRSPSPASEGSASQGSGLRVTGIVLASAGIVVAGLGLGFNLHANSLADDFNRTQTSTDRSSSSTFKTASIVCYGAGAGATAAGVLLYLIGRSAATSDTQLSFLPMFAPRAFALAMHKGF
ncbi:MAG: hypothetical protein ABSB49_00055 [Polyangia bacterium]|jgi:hypothetical protein